MDIRTEIDIDTDLFEYLPFFWQRRKDDIAALNQSLQTEDFQKTAEICHSIKGVAASYGYPTLGDLCKELESFAKQKNLAACEQLLRKLETYLSEFLKV